MIYIIPCLTILFLILSILFYPTIKIKNIEIETFWIVSLIGASFILLTRTIPFEDVINELLSDRSINPIKILIILLSVSFLSISLDEVNFFGFVASKAIKFVKGSPLKLFTILYVLIAILTMFTSNDIVILTFTLFICYFSKEAKINPIPYLVMEFIVANTYSMIFIIGNPTNIYIASSYNISFDDYFKVMALPTLITGFFSYFILLFIFKKELKKPIPYNSFKEKKLSNIPLTIICLIHLLSAMIMLAISSYISIDMWIISLLFAFSLLIFVTIYSIKTKRNMSFNIIKRLPWNLIVFVISMFIIVSSLNYHNIFKSIASFLTALTNKNKLLTIFVYGFFSSICDNLINNIPMSLAFTEILKNTGDSFLLSEVYATIIGSNIGAFLTPVGALAGIMWMKILKEEKIKFTFFDFTKYGLILTSSLLFISLLSLSLII